MKKHFDACVSLLSRNKEDPFLHRIVTCDKNSSFMIIVSVQQAGWIRMKHQNTAQIQLFIKRSSWLLLGGAANSPT